MANGGIVEILSCPWLNSVTTSWMMTVMVSLTKKSVFPVLAKARMTVLKTENAKTDFVLGSAPERSAKTEKTTIVTVRSMRSIVFLSNVTPPIPAHLCLNAHRVNANESAKRNVVMTDGTTIVMGK